MSDSHETDSRAPESTNRVKRFFSNPVFGVVGSISGVIGIILFIVSRTSPDLVYYVDPTRATVVRVNQSSRLHIELDGEAIERNVTAAQIIIWNDGKESIRGKNILSPFIIKTGPHNPIIEADIQKVTREVIGLRLDKSKIGEGQLGVDWTILEQGDGAILQLIYFGDAQTSITASAIVEQQGDVRGVEYNRARKKWMKKGVLWGVIIPYGFLVFIIAMIGVCWYLLRLETEPFWRKMAVLLQIFWVALGAKIIYDWWAEPSPPFGF